MSTKPLRLLARTAEDVPVLSAMLQDAAVRVGDIAYLPAERRFAAALNRYRWEARRRAVNPAGERVRAGLHIDYVLAAKTMGIPFDDPDIVLNLLAIAVQPDEDEAATLTLTFSGGAAVRLDVECIEAVLEDLTKPWRARKTPSHSEA
ncbi:MAG: DUF2948 family protein [Rhodothalassiaceae bacterium]